MMNHLCPGCGRHCYPDEAQCERGAEYAKTGVLPPRKPRTEGNRGGGRRSEQKMEYLAMDRDEKIAWSLKELGNAISAQEEFPSAEMLNCLREDDAAYLLMFLEKIRHAWYHKDK